MCVLVGLRKSPEGASSLVDRESWREVLSGAFSSWLNSCGFVRHFCCVRDADRYQPTMQKAIDEVRDAFQSGNFALLQELWNATMKTVSLPKKVALLHDCLELFTDEPSKRKAIKFLISKTAKKCFLKPHRSGQKGRLALSSACLNAKIPLEIIKQVHKRDTTAVSTAINGLFPLHAACLCSAARVDVVEFIADKHPDALRHVMNSRFLPFHCACSPDLMSIVAETMRFKDIEEVEVPKVSFGVVKLLLEKYPESLDHNESAISLLLASSNMNDEAWRLLLLLFAKRPGQLTLNAVVRFLIPHNPPLNVLQQILPVKAPLAPASADLTSIDEPIAAQRFSAEDFTVVLEEAIRKRLSVKSIRCIIECCPEAFQKTDALHLACSGPNKSLEVVRYLYQLDEQALHTFSDMYCCSHGNPMHTLVYEWNYNNCHRHFQTEEYLQDGTMDVIKYFASEDPSILLIPSPPNNDGYCLEYSPLRYACREWRRQNQSPLILFLMQQSSEDVVREAAFAERASVMLMHLPQVFPNWSEWRNEDGDSVLHLPPDDGHDCLIRASTVEELLTDDTGLCQNKMGDTPLHSCIRNLSTDAQLLWSFTDCCSGATIIRNKEGMMPIHMLNERCNDKEFSDLLPMLVELNNHSIGLLDGKGRNVLHTACAERHTYNRVKLLVDSCRNAVSVKDGSGCPLPFYALARDDNFSTLELILAQDPSGQLALQRDSSGNSLLHVACKTKGCSLIVQYLVRTYPDMTGFQNNRGCLPLHVLLSSPIATDLETTEMMIQGNGKSVTITDPQTGMLPFLAAAKKPSISLDVVYKLVRLSVPEALISFSNIRVRPNKRQKTSPRAVAPPPPAPKTEELWFKTVPMLKDMLRERELKVGGKKAELIDRLLES